MIRAWLWRILDTVAHLLYSPVTLGRQGVWPPRWYHHVHLISSRLFDAICTGYERRLLDAADDEYEYEDLTAAPEGWTCEHLTEDEFDALAASGEPVTVVGTAVPNGWTCEHVTATAGGAATLLSAQAWCGCVMRPYYATTR